jgi:hypothetical protein
LAEQPRKVDQKHLAFPVSKALKPEKPKVKGDWEKFIGKT